MRTQWKPVIALAALALAGDLRSASAQSADLTKLSIEDLLNTEITSVSRKEQTLSRTAAAVHVITQEDIRRSGAKVIPDLLRMVPGFAVAQVDAGSWAITSRGFNGIYANKLLVLIDGRSVYTPLFAGVHWDMQNLPLDEIDRIEVVRGPGGTLWGANAVNGVINIITKRADTTQGGRATAGVGGQQRGIAELRYSGAFGADSYYRVYGKRSNRGYGSRVAGFSNPDDGQATLGGFRVDRLGDINQFALFGSVQEGHGSHVRSRTLLAAPWKTMAPISTKYTDGHLVFSWTRSTSSQAESSVQASYQGYGRTATALYERWHIIDVDARRRQVLGDRHEINAGVGYRFWSNVVESTPTVSFSPAREQTHLVTGFVQDEITVAKTLHVTAGSKFEHNAYTGIEVQPSLRMTWTPARGHAFWAAASRAVRTPSKSDRGLAVTASLAPAGPGRFMWITVEGNPDIDSEILQAFEAGYRVQAGAVSVDVTAFQNEYSDLQSSEPGAVRPDMYQGRPVLHLPIRFANLARASGTGAEITANWQPVDRWRTTASYSAIRLTVEPVAGSVDTSGPEKAGSVPEQHFSVRSYVDLFRNFDASVLVYHVGAVKGLDVPAYTKLDARLGWTAGKLGLAVGVENLFNEHSTQMVETTGIQSVPQRKAGYFEATWRF